MPNIYQNGGKAPKTPVINRWEGEGIVHPRSGNDADEIKFFEFKKQQPGMNQASGAIHISIEVIEENGMDASTGQPKVKRAYVPVNVLTNKNIQEQQLRAVKTGMKVHVVGKLQSESYTSNKDGQRKTALVVNAYVFEILAMPQQVGYQQGYGPQIPPQQAPGYGQQPGFPPQQAPYGQMPYPGGYPGYAPQGYPQQGGYPPQQPAYQPPQYPPQPQQQPYGNAQPQQAPTYQQPAYATHGAAPAAQTPPYYQPGPQAPMPPMTDDDDMPPGTPIHV